MDVIDRVPDLRVRAGRAFASSWSTNATRLVLIRVSSGEDMPDIANWKWPY